MNLDDEALRCLLDNIPVGIGIAEPVEPDGSIKPEARVVYYNKEWVKMFGFDVDDVRTVKEATWRLYPDPGLLEHRLRARKEAAVRSREGCGEETEARAMGRLPTRAFARALAARSSARQSIRNHAAAPPTMATNKAATGTQSNTRRSTACQAEP